MCGLIGFNGKGDDVVNPAILSLIMASNDTRGGDSSGFYDGEEFHKCIGTTGGVFKNIMESKSDMIIGHTRKSTHGKITLKNQHPFKYGDVVGAHNGVVNNYEAVGKKFNLKKTDVDSQMIFKVLNKTGDDKDLGLFNGGLATLYTKGDDKLYAYRHSNPMYVGRNEQGSLYFSSKKEVLIHCGLKNIWSLKEDRLYIFQNGECISKEDIKRNVVAGGVGSTDWNSYGNYNYGGGYRNWQTIGKNYVKQKNNQLAIPVKSEKKEVATIDDISDNYFDDVDSYNGSYEMEFEELTQKFAKTLDRLEDLKDLYSWNMTMADRKEMDQIVLDFDDMKQELAELVINYESEKEYSEEIGLELDELKKKFLKCQKAHQKKSVKKINKK